MQALLLSAKKMRRFMAHLSRSNPSSTPNTPQSISRGCTGAHDLIGKQLISVISPTRLHLKINHDPLISSGWHELILNQGMKSVISLL